MVIAGLALSLLLTGLIGFWSGSAYPSFLFLLIVFVYASRVRGNARFATSTALSILSVYTVSVFLTFGAEVDLIGKSDGLTYHLVGMEVDRLLQAGQVPLLEIVDDAAARFGLIVPNPAMYFLVGVAYSILGSDAALSVLVHANALALIAIVHLAVRSAEQLVGRRSLMRPAVLLAAAALANVWVCALVLELRKDLYLHFFLAFAIYLMLKRSYLLALVSLLCVIGFRLVYLPLVCTLLFLAWQRDKPLGHVVRRVAVFAVLCSAWALGFFPNWLSAGLASIGLDGVGDSDLNVALGVSGVFAYSAYLQWIYILLYPFPSLSLASYSQSAQWFALAGFALNFVLMAGVLTWILSRKPYEWKTDVIALGWLIALVTCIINLSAAVALERIGVMEARYKMGLWMLGAVLVMAMSSRRAKDGL